MFKKALLLAFFCFNIGVSNATSLQLSPEGCLSYASGVYTFGLERDKGTTRETIVSALKSFDFAYPEIRTMLLFWVDVVFYDKAKTAKEHSETFLYLCANERGILDNLYRKV